MLKITIPEAEQWDEVNQLFVNTKEQTLMLEHSLVSLSKWESRWCKPFLKKNERTPEEIMDYIRCMTVTPNVRPEVYMALTNENVLEVKKYIDSPMTATTITKIKHGGSSRETVTSELIYYWMIALDIPFECQKWHLNRLLTLIEICNIKNQKPRKMGMGERMRRNTDLNAARRRRLNTRG